MEYLLISEIMIKFLSYQGSIVLFFLSTETWLLNLNIIFIKSYTEIDFIY